MRYSKRLLTAILALLFIPWTAALAQDGEDALIRETIQHYFQGHATGNGEYFRKAFHPDAKLFFIRDGKLTQWTSEEYIGRASGKPAADEAQRKRRIDSIDVSGNAAIVRVTLDYPSVVFTDYMSMLKIDGQWKIVNKTFYAKPRS
jgi:putative lumazine-binding protein